MALKCHVSLLDGCEADFEVGKNAKASTLLDEVCQHLNIVEKDYFGLIYKGSSLQHAWMTLDKKIKKQIRKNAKIEFAFAVKFYPTDPTKLKEEITRYQICLQVRKDLAGNLSCSVVKLTHLLSYWLQSEYEGKNNNAKAVKECLKGFQNPLEEASSAEFIDRVLTLYRERRDMLSADADNQFLTYASGLRSYGVQFYKGKEAAGNEILIGIGAKGVIENREGQIPVFHSWSSIKNIVYKNTKFKLKLLRAPANGDPRLKKSFLFHSEAQVHAMWKSAVEHHVFFRGGEKDKKTSDSTKKPKKKKSILRRFSSRKKKPKTETDVQEQAKGIIRQPPTVTRASSLRRSASLRMSTSSESSRSVEHQVVTVATTPGGETYSVSRQPQMDSEVSSVFSSAESTKPQANEAMEVTVPLISHEDTHAQKAEDKEHYEGREYKDEDLMEAVIGKLDCTTSGGSSTLLLTETIPEEDEEEHRDALSSPRKRVPPKHFAPLRDRELRNFTPGDGGFTHAMVSRPMETPDTNAFELKAPDDEDAQHLERHIILMEHTEFTEEYTEVREDVQDEPTQSEDKIPECQVNDNSHLADERKLKDFCSSSSQRTSFDDGNIRFNSQREQQKQKFRDTLPSPRKQAPGAPRRYASLRDGEPRTHLGPTPDDGGFDREKVTRSLETDFDAEVLFSPGLPGTKDTDGFDLDSPDGGDARHLERQRILLEHTEFTEEYTEVWEDVHVEPIHQPKKVGFKLAEEKTSERESSENPPPADECKHKENPPLADEHKPKDSTSSPSSYIQEYTEVWEDVHVEPIHQPKKVGFKLAEEKTSERESSENPPPADECKHKDSTSSSSTYIQEYTEVWEDVHVEPIHQPKKVGFKKAEKRTSERESSENTPFADEHKPKDSTSSSSSNIQENAEVWEDVHVEPIHQPKKVGFKLAEEKTSERESNENPALADEHKPKDSTSSSSSYIQEYTEVWEDVHLEPIQQPKKVGFKQAEETTSERESSENPPLADERKPKDSTSSSSSCTSYEEGEIRYDSPEKEQIQNLPENEVLHVQNIPLPTFDDLSQSTIHQEENIDQHVITIKEYIPRIRKDSTEDETDEDDNGEFIIDSGKESPQREIDLNDLPQESENIDDMVLQGQGSDDEIEPEGEVLVSQSSSREDLSLLPDQPSEYLSRGREESGKEDESIEEEYEDDFEEYTSEEKKSEDEDDPSCPRNASVKDDNSNQSPIGTVPKELAYRLPTHGVSIDFRMGENYKLTPPAKSGKGERIPDGAASTTAATVGDEDEFALEELDREILYEEEHPRQKEQLDDYHLSDEEEQEEEEAGRSLPSPPGESASRSTSMSDITDNTDELLEPNILEKTWSQGAGLDEDDELFQILFRTPPRRRKHRNRSEINPRDVRKGKQQAIAFRTGIDEEPVSPRRRDKLSRRPFIPSWSFDPMSLLNSSELGILDKEAIKAALSAQRELIDGSKRIEDIEMLEDVDFSSPEDEEVKFQSRSHESLEKPEQFSRSENTPTHSSEKETEFLGARSRSPSASPRMVGEEFIPGVPNFVHSVLPHQLDTPSDPNQSESSSRDASLPAPDIKKSVDPEFMKFPQPIKKFPRSSNNTEPLTYRYSPPVGIEALPVGQCESSAEESDAMTFKAVAIPDNPQSRGYAQPTTSSGRSTPQSAGGNTSQSDVTTSSNSKSSSSSFPRFIHSVFPLRRSSSSDRRGRSKTRKKKEKKITKQKGKKKPRSKSKEKKKNTERTVPVIEITSPADVSVFAAFSNLPSPPHYAMFSRQIASSQTSQEHMNAPTFASEEQPTSNGIGESRSHYDLENLDKIILSESDDAHSVSGTSETARRDDVLSDIVPQRSMEPSNLQQQ